mgnify:CR=1 FL=1
MPTQKDCKYSQLSQLSQISGQIAFDKIYEYGRAAKVEHYFSGIFSSTATRNFQVSATEAMFTRSSGE